MVSFTSLTPRFFQSFQCYFTDLVSILVDHGAFHGKIYISFSFFYSYLQSLDSRIPAMAGLTISMFILLLIR